MSERLLKLGVPPEFFAHAKHFESVFRDLGYTPAQIDASIEWGASFAGKPEDLLPQFDRFCQQQDIHQVNADLAINWHSQVAEKGIEGMPQPAATPASGDDRQRLQEIEEEMRKRAQTRNTGGARRCGTNTANCWSASKPAANPRRSRPATMAPAAPK